MAQLKAGSTAGGQVIATQDWVTSTIVDGAPSALNTLNELAAAINDNSSYAASITTALSGKLSTTGKAADSDKLDGYHASSFWRNGVNNTWTPSTNILLPQSGNSQEWSFDITRNGYTGGYWQVWDSANKTMLKVDAVSGKVSAPYGFIGNLQGNITGSAASATTAGSATTATTATNLGSDYTADDWFRATGDNNHVKFYGNSRQMLFRTDGTTEAYGGIGAYPFVWTYNGSNSGNRLMILHTNGRLWTSNYGWLDEKFQVAGSYAASSHNHDSTYLKLSGGTVTGNLEVNSNTFKVGRHIDAKNGWSGGSGELFLGWYSDKLVIGNDVYGKHDFARDMPLNSIAVNNPLYSWKNIALGRNASMPTAEWGATSASTGFVVIEFPVSSYAMIHAEIAVYEYNGYNASTVLVGGHPWNNGWHSYGSKTLGELGKQVRFAQIAETGVYCIVLGDAGSSWTYGQVQLKRIQNGNYYDNRVPGNGDFRIYQGTDEGIFSMITPDTSGSIDVNRAATADSATSATSAVNADKVDNLHASSFIRSDADDNVSGHTEWQDGKQIRLGNGADFRMWFDGSHTYFRNYNHGNGNIYFQGEDTEGSNHALLYMETANSRPYVKLYENGGERLRTTSSGVTVYGGSLTVAKNGTDSYIHFPGQTNDPGYIRHYESNNTARMYFSVSDDNGTTDFFAFGYSGNVDRFRIYSNGTFLARGTSTIEGDLYVNRVYDRNNTGYYVDPASTNRLDTVEANYFRGFKDKAYKVITVDGEPDIFYPVRIGGSATYGLHRYSISRSYSAPAPNTWNTASHRGGLTLTVDWSGDTAWGGNDKTMRVVQFDETYTTVAGGITLPVTGGMLVWLRGGGAQYYVHAPNGSAVNTTVELNGYEAGNGVRYEPRSMEEAQSTGRNEIHDRWPVRDNNLLYDSNNRVATETWTDSNFLRVGEKAADAQKVDGINGASLLRSDANDTFTGTLTMGKQHALVANNYGRGVYGIYSSTKYQHVWGMGTAYNLADDGSNTGNLYGIAWTHQNIGGESVSGLGHQMLIMSNGDTRSAIGDGIWTKYNIYASGGNSTEWNAAYDWGNHAGLYDGAGSADAVNQRIDEEVLPAIDTKLDASVNPIKSATVSNDTITFTRSDNTTFNVTTSDANTNTWRGIYNNPVNGETSSSISADWAWDQQVAAARVKGWVPAYSNSNSDTVFYNPREQAVVIDGAGDTAVGAAYKAIFAAGGTKIRFTITVRGNVASSNGMYLRIYHKAGTSLPDGKTHVSNDASYSFVQEDSSGKTNWYENGAVPSTYTTYETGYVVPSDGYVSLVVLNWSGHGNNQIFIKEANADIETVNYATGAGTANAVAWNNVTGKPSTFTPSNHAASKVTSGTFANARISQSSVTQHQGALSIAASQVTGLPEPNTPATINGGESTTIVSVNFNLDRGTIEYQLGNGQVINGAIAR